MGRRPLLAAAVGGTVAGAIVGYLPGVSSAIAAAAVLAVIPAAAGARGFLVATSGVNTANTVFALLALVVLGTPRTGVMVPLNDAGVPLNLPLLLAAVGIAAAISFPLVILLGDPYLRLVGSVDYTRLSIALLCGLCGLAYFVAGPVGVAAFVAGGLIGLVPPRTGSRRVHCMGVLIGPLILAG